MSVPSVRELYSMGQQDTRMEVLQFTEENRALPRLIDCYTLMSFTHRNRTFHELSRPLAWRLPSVIV